MAKTFLVPINLGGLEIQSPLIHTLAKASEPTGAEGQIYTDTTNHLLMFHDGSGWETISFQSDVIPATTGGTGQTSYAVGDILHAPTTTTVTGLTAVAAGRLLRSAGVDTVPAYSTLTIPNTILQDSVLVTNADNILVALQVGNGQSIRLNAGGTLWEAFTPSAGIGNHNLLNATEHPDTVSQTVSRGSLIVGKTATPVWDELDIGGANTIVGSDGTDTTFMTRAALDLAYHDGSPTTDGIPQWSATEGQLTDGLTLATTVGSPGVDTALVTEQGIREAIDASAAGLDVKESVVCNSDDTSNEGVTYAYNSTGGTSARGQITWATGPTTIDGVTLANDDRILNSETGAAGGIYIRTSATVWDRATDFDEDDEVTANAFTFVEEGTNHADSGWVLTTDDPIIIGGASGTSLTWTQFSGIGSYTWGDGLENTAGTTIAVDLKANGGLVIESTEIAVKLDATSITGILGLADGGIGIDASGATNGQLLIGGTTSNDLQLASLTGTTNEISITPGVNSIEIGISGSYDGGASIVTVGTIATGTWEGDTIAVDQGGTGQTSYTNGQLLIGNTTGNTLSKATLTEGEGVTITNGTGSITLALDINGLTNAGTTLGDTDLFAFYDATTDTRVEKITWANVKAQFSTDGYAKKFTGTIGNGALTTIDVTHGLATQYVTAQVFRDTTPWEEMECDVEQLSGTQTRFKFAVAPTSNQYRVVITG